jgi:hypothetical protein
MLKRIFGKWGLPAEPPSPPIDDGTNMIPLSIDDIARYVKAAARRRGYPDDSFDMIARRVCFLERRGLPGFMAFVREMGAYAHEGMDERAAYIRPDGSRGGHCPIIASVALNQELGRIAALQSGQSLQMTAPSNPLLVLPKLANYAGPRGLVLSLAYYEGEEIVATGYADGFRVVHYGKTEPMFVCDKVGYSVCPEDWMDEIRLRAGYLDRTEQPEFVVSRILRFIEEGR